MKAKHILSFLIFFHASLNAQDTYRISFDLQDFSIENNNGILSISPTQHDYFLLGDTLSPALPYMTYHILRPENSNSSNFEVHMEKEMLLEDVSILSNPKEITIGSVPANVDSEDIVTLASKSTLTPCIFAGDHCLKGYSFASFNVTPFVYDAVQKELSFVSEMTIVIKPQITKNFRSNNKVRRKADKDEILSKVINPRDFSRFYSGISLNTDTSAENVEFLIVTTDELVESFKPLMGWKIQKGIRSEIITINDIYAIYEGNTQQLKIKHCLQDYYQNKGLKWVLLGGDDTLVPVQRCYAINGKIEDSRIPTDLFYACFDNAFSWDANENGITGEVADNIDLYPEVYVSRLPIRNSEDVNVFISKLLLYEKQATTISNANTLLLAGTQLWDWVNNPLNQSDAHQKSEKMYNEYIAPYWNATKYHFYDTGTSFEGNASYDLTASNLQNK